MTSVEMNKGPCTRGIKHRAQLLKSQADWEPAHTQVFGGVATVWPCCCKAGSQQLTLKCSSIGLRSQIAQSTLLLYKKAESGRRVKVRDSAVWNDGPHRNTWEGVFDLSAGFHTKNISSWKFRALRANKNSFCRLTFLKYQQMGDFQCKNLLPLSHICLVHIPIRTPFGGHKRLALAQCPHQCSA